MTHLLLRITFLYAAAFGHVLLVFVCFFALFLYFSKKIPLTTKIVRQIFENKHLTSAHFED